MSRREIECSARGITRGSTIRGIVLRRATILRMLARLGRLVLAVLLVFVRPMHARAADERDPLAKARSLYKEQQFEAAIAAAEQARLTQARADSADLIAARAYLERFRASAASDDLTSARDRLRRLDPVRFGARERVEFVVGLGEALYYEGAFGAAADVFGSIVARAEVLAPDARDRALDWWATALDRDARARPDLERQAVYQRVRDRMRQELVDRPESATGAYWLSAAALGQGDWQAAWDAAEAGWVRAPLGTDRGKSLREDLDQLMQRGIVSERAKATAMSPDDLRGEWEQFKARWAR